MKVSLCEIGERPGPEGQRGVLEKQAEAGRSRLIKGEEDQWGVENLELGRCGL